MGFISFSILYHFNLWFTSSRGEKQFHFIKKLPKVAMSIFTTWESHSVLICFVHPLFLTQNCRGTSLDVGMYYPSVTSNAVSFSPVLSRAFKPELTSKLDLWKWLEARARKKRAEGGGFCSKFWVKQALSLPLLQTGVNSIVQFYLLCSFIYEKDLQLGACNCKGEH